MVAFTYRLNRARALVWLWGEATPTLMLIGVRGGVVGNVLVWHVSGQGSIPATPGTFCDIHRHVLYHEGLPRGR